MSEVQDGGTKESTKPPSPKPDQDPQDVGPPLVSVSKSELLLHCQVSIYHLWLCITAQDQIIL